VATKDPVPEALESLISRLNKGLGSLGGSLDPGQVPQFDWNLLREDLSLPTAVLYHDRLMHNLEWMQEFIAAYGLRLAPHGKTTMAPRLFEMQLQSGAWGITVATAQQSLVAYTHGVRRVLMANELVGKENMATVGRMLRDPGFEFFCLVDSAAQVEQLGSYFSAQDQHLHALIELGVMGGRTGVRDSAQLNQVLDALARWRETIALDGVEMYEGVLEDEGAIRTFLRRAVGVARRLRDERRFSRNPFLLSGAGSAWYDVVAEEFAAARFDDLAEIVLRPGCYLTHDVGAYRKAQQRILANNAVAHQMSAGLVPALHVWAYVQSIPEDQKAIIGMGRRDAAFDSGLPVPALHYRPGDSSPHAAPPHWETTKLMDQHAFLRIAPNDDLRVGDMIGFDVCHPCLTFDKWRTLPIVDANFKVIEVIQTYF